MGGRNGPQNARVAPGGERAPGRDQPHPPRELLRQSEQAEAFVRCKRNCKEHTFYLLLGELVRTLPRGASGVIELGTGVL